VNRDFRQLGQCPYRHICATCAPTVGAHIAGYGRGEELSLRYVVVVSRRRVAVSGKRDFASIRPLHGGGTIIRESMERGARWCVDRFCHWS
jgi:hypothetical protein